MSLKIFFHGFTRSTVDGFEGEFPGTFTQGGAAATGSETAENQDCCCYSYSFHLIPLTSLFIGNRLLKTGVFIRILPLNLVPLMGVFREKTGITGACRK